MRNLAIVAAVVALALAGCSRQGPTPPDEAAAEDNYVEPEPVAPPAEEPAPPPEANAVENLAADEPAPEPVDPSEQTLDDADATGLTTRALPNAEDEDAPVGGNETGESGGE